MLDGPMYHIISQKSRVHLTGPCFCTGRGILRILSCVCACAVVGCTCVGQLACVAHRRTDRAGARRSAVQSMMLEEVTLQAMWSQPQRRQKEI